MLVFLIESTAPEASRAPGNLWTALPSLLWIALAAIALLIFREDLAKLIQNLSWRMRTGAAIKLFSFEFGASYVAPGLGTTSNESSLQHHTDDGTRWHQREQYYTPNRNIHLVHRVAPSNQPAMLYDIEIYLVAHKNATLASVSKVDYYFGRHWGNQIFTSIDRARTFAVTTSAYGPFMCTAELFFSDGQRVFINRYVDFEMGGIGKALPEENPTMEKTRES